ncbi:hypothetical protein Tco_1527801, partial [Tanacetum coccineum]
HVIDPSYLEDQLNLHPTFVAIGFDCLLNINEKISLIFVLQFYKSVCLIRNLNGILSMAFIIQNVKITLRLEEFSRTLHVPCHGDPLLICDALFDPRPLGKTCKVKGVDVILDPFQMVISELKTNFKKQEIILTGNKDHPNACLCYMLYCLATRKHFNLACYMVNRMISVTKSADMSLPYRMLLTQLVEHVRVFYPHVFSEDLYLVDYVMTPLSKRRVFRIMPGGKRPRLLTPTPSASFESTSSSNRSTFTHRRRRVTEVKANQGDVQVPRSFLIQPREEEEEVRVC